MELATVTMFLLSSALYVIANALRVRQQNRERREQEDVRESLTAP